MKTLSFDAEGLTEEQIELARQFVELMKRSGERKEGLQYLIGSKFKGSRFKLKERWRLKGLKTLKLCNSFAN